MTDTEPSTRPKLEAKVVLPDGKGEAWVRFAPDGTPLADYRAESRFSWTPVDKLGGSVVVAP